MSQRSFGYNLNGAQFLEHFKATNWREDKWKLIDGTIGYMRLNSLQGIYNMFHLIIAVQIENK